MIVIRVCSHFREVTEYLTSFSTDIVVRLLKKIILRMYTKYFHFFAHICKCNTVLINILANAYTVTFFMISCHTILAVPISHCHKTFFIMISLIFFILFVKLIHSSNDILPRHLSFFYCLFRVLKIFTFCFN